MGCGEELPAERQYTGVDGGFGCGVWLNDVVFVNGIPGELAPFSSHTHTMKGGSLNVMEVVGTSRSQCLFLMTAWLLGRIRIITGEKKIDLLFSQT